MENPKLRSFKYENCYLASIASLLDSDFQANLTAFAFKRSTTPKRLGGLAAAFDDSFLDFSNNFLLLFMPISLFLPKLLAAKFGNVESAGVIIRLFYLKLSVIILLTRLLGRRAESTMAYRRFFLRVSPVLVKFFPVWSPPISSVEEHYRIIMPFPWFDVAIISISFTLIDNPDLTSKSLEVDYFRLSVGILRGISDFSLVAIPFLFLCFLL